MKSQPETKKEKKKKLLKVLFSVDDVHPELGFGLYKENDNFKYLIRLNKEFNLKFTLFVVPKWLNNPKFDIKDNLDWIKWIQEKNYFEIAGHGIAHTSENPDHKHLEFYNLPPETIAEGLKLSKQMFAECGVNITGWKSPGWLHSNSIYDGLKKSGFVWIADHIFGETPIKLTNDIFQVPYNCSTEDLDFAYPENVAIFHSHINQANNNLNGWSEERYLETREYLLKLQEEYEFIPMTFSEYVEDFKQLK